MAFSSLHLTYSFFFSMLPNALASRNFTWQMNQSQEGKGFAGMFFIWEEKETKWPYLGEPGAKSVRVSPHTAHSSPRFPRPERVPHILSGGAMPSPTTKYFKQNMCPWAQAFLFLKALQVILLCTPCKNCCLKGERERKRSRGKCPSMLKAEEKKRLIN